MGQKDHKKAILELLAAHRHGLTFAELSRMTGLNRLTVTRYVYELVGAKKVSQRQVGKAKLNYLSKFFKKRL